MKQKRILTIGSLLIIFTIVLLISANTLVACSGFVVRKDGDVLIGHNKDWWSPDTYIHVYPADQDSYARLFLEIPFPHIFNSEYMVLAGGVNEHGLCYESFVTPFKLASFELFKPPLFKNPVDYIAQHFTTVEEVVDYIESHNLFFLNYILCSGQIFVIDRTGDAAIIEGDEIIRIQKDYQICTNFLQSDPELGNYPCWRYELLTTELENATDISVSNFESLLESVQLFSQYSWVYNPNESILHLYHFHDYKNSIEIDLKEEFNQEAHSYYLPSLFEPGNNTPPIQPQKPIGPSTGVIDTEYIFETNTTDSDNPQNELYYFWDFDDGTQQFWTHHSEEHGGAISHSWEQPGLYEIKVKAKDIYGRESQWSDSFQIQITKSNQGFIEAMLYLFKN